MKRRNMQFQGRAEDEKWLWCFWLTKQKCCSRSRLRCCPQFNLRFTGTLFFPTRGSRWAEASASLSEQSQSPEKQLVAGYSAFALSNLNQKQRAWTEAKCTGQTVSYGRGGAACSNTDHSSTWAGAFYPRPRGTCSKEMPGFYQEI